MNRRRHHVERRLVAVGAVLLGVYNIVLAMLRAPLAGIGQIRHVVPIEAVHGSRFVLLIVGLILLETAPGLWHGKRLAWVITLGAAIASVLAHPFLHVDIWGTGASLALAGALVGARPQFSARSDPPTAMRGAAFLVTGLAIVFIYSTLGLYFLDREFKQAIPFTNALKDTIRLLFIVPATAAEPTTRHGTWFVDSVRVGFLSMMVLGVWQLLRPVIYRARTSHIERERVGALLQRYGNSSIAFFALLPDKAYFFSRGGKAVLAYKVVGSTAVVMGDPIGEESEFSELVDSFQEHCELNDWAYAFHQVTPRYLQLYMQHGLKALKIGEEGIVQVQDFALSGHATKHLRSTMNYFERDGYRAEVLRPPHEPALLRRLREISDEWLAQGDRRERGFTLGYFDEAMLQECDILAVRGSDGSIVAFANIIPSYRLPQGNFDMLRYGPEPRRVADFLYVSLIDCFRERGYSGMNIGLAPFSGLQREGPMSPAERAMDLLYRRGSFLFRYRGLREFKEKFLPVWEARYLVYSSEIQLPGIALAVARAAELRRKLPWQAARGEPSA
jgi:phosphatidylglycerol lysyltransferase